MRNGSGFSITYRCGWNRTIGFIIHIIAGIGVGPHFKIVGGVAFGTGKIGILLKALCYLHNSGTIR